MKQSQADLSHGSILDGATKERQSISADWEPVGQRRIDGVEVIEITSVPKRSGVLTEVFRREWLADAVVDQVFQVLMHLAWARPRLVVVPAGVWHGLQATGVTPALVLNLPDTAYQYEDPDHWRLPFDSPQIPYRFGTGETLT